MTLKVYRHLFEIINENENAFVSLSFSCSLYFSKYSTHILSNFTTIAINLNLIKLECVTCDIFNDFIVYNGQNVYVKKQKIEYKHENRINHENSFE